MDAREIEADLTEVLVTEEPSTESTAAIVRSAPSGHRCAYVSSVSAAVL